MKLTFEDGAQRVSRVIGERPMRLGREPSNDLVIGDDSVSRFHAVIFTEGDAVVVHDLGSINGTHVNGTKITAPTRVRAGDRVRFGDRFEVSVETAVLAARALRYTVAVAGSQASFPIVADRFYIGSDEDADLVLPGLDEPVVLMLDKGSVWIGRGDEEVAVVPGEPIAVGPHQVFVRAEPVSSAATVQPSDRALCAVSVDMVGGNMVAALLLRESGRKLELGTGIRSMLFFVLGGQLLADRDRALEAPGWCEDALVKSALWGKKGDDNKLNVLLHRLRADLRKAQLDPWVVERRDRRLRARLGRVELSAECLEQWKRLAAQSA